MPYILPSATLAALLLLGGCGQMGPLYEPEQDAATSSAPATTD